MKCCTHSSLQVSMVHKASTLTVPQTCRTSRLLIGGNNDSWTKSTRGLCVSKLSFEYSCVIYALNKCPINICKIFHLKGGFGQVWQGFFCTVFIFTTHAHLTTYPSYFLSYWYYKIINHKAILIHRATY